MNIAHIEKYSLIYGPGVRFVIWTQGCSIRCPGCWNKDMWSFKPKNILSTEQILKQIYDIKKEIEGITILGGEPFDQYDELLDLVKKIYKFNLSIILYTGYELDELKKRRQTEILNFIDILITGRFIEKYKSTNGGLIGSSNQKIIFISDRYSEKDISKTNEIEISIDEMGKIIVYGYPYDSLEEII